MTTNQTETLVQRLVMSPAWDAMLMHQQDFEVKTASHKEEVDDFKDWRKEADHKRFAHYVHVRWLSVSPDNRASGKYQVDKACAQSHNVHIKDAQGLKPDAVRAISRIVGHKTIMQYCAEFKDGRGIVEHTEVLEMFEDKNIKSINQMRKILHQEPTQAQEESKLAKDANKLNVQGEPKQGSKKECWEKCSKAVDACEAFESEEKHVLKQRIMRGFEQAIKASDTKAEKLANADARNAAKREREENKKLAA